jgi:hypothetical protein
MTTSFTEAGHDGSFIMSEAAGKRSRENVVLDSGQDLPAGAVLGKLTSGGNYTAYIQGAGTGEGTAVAILINATDASDGDVAVAIISRDAEVNLYQLDWGTETGSDMDAGIVDLATRGIICRERPEVDAS